MNKQIEFEYWNKTIDKKRQQNKDRRIERKNEWIRKNLIKTPT